MANIRLIKRRIKSSQNIAQITRAMELVAAAKMKKAQLAALSGKLYADKIYEMVMRSATMVSLETHPLLRKPKPTGKRLVILISTNKGLCGGLNTALFRFFVHQYPKNSSYDLMTLGKKGADFMTRIGHSIKADFSDTIPFESTIPAFVTLITDEYLKGIYEGVDIVSNEFLSLVNHEPRKKTLLPLMLEHKTAYIKKEASYDLLIEPNAEEVFNLLLPHYMENQIRDAVLEAEASEHSARMIAMHNATDNAQSLKHELTLMYNKVRQEKITYEITDMVTARLAVE